MTEKDRREALRQYLRSTSGAPQPKQAEPDAMPQAPAKSTENLEQGAYKPRPGMSPELARAYYETQQRLQTAGRWNW